MSLIKAVIDYNTDYFNVFQQFTCVKNCWICSCSRHWSFFLFQKKFEFYSRYELSGAITMLPNDLRVAIRGLETSFLLFCIWVIFFLNLNHSEMLRTSLKFYFIIRVCSIIVVGGVNSDQAVEFVPNLCMCFPYVATKC